MDDHFELMSANNRMMRPREAKPFTRACAYTPPAYVRNMSPAEIEEAVKATDPVIFLAISLLLAFVILLACYFLLAVPAASIRLSPSLPIEKAS
jgi:hypothetical protein